MAPLAGEQEPEVRLREESRIVLAADRLVAASEGERAYFVDEFGASADRVATIPCGVDTELFRPGDRAEARARLGLPDGPVLLYVGRIAPIKGLHTLLDAMAHLAATRPGLRLLVVGGDADDPINGHERTLRERIDVLGIGPVVGFVGAQPQERLRDYYVAADAVVLPS